MKPAVLFISFLMMLLPAQEAEDLDLPDWEDDELEALESGEYVPGSALMGTQARAILDTEEQEVIELDPIIRDLPEIDPGLDELAKIVREEFTPVYFHLPPVGFLNDPQVLLTTQENLDVEEFLDYHVGDTNIDCYLYIFDGPQELPEGESLEALVKTQFNPAARAAVVFYFLGSPEKTQLAFTERVIEDVAQEERDKVLLMAIEEAMQKSDSSSQLDSFLIQLSKGAGSLLSRRLMLPQDEGVVASEDGIWERLVKNEVLFYGLMIAGILIPAALLGFLGKWIADKRRVYLFPDAEGSPLLEAPHAAGVGGVLSFVSATAPPSSQNKDGPDYLQKM